MIRRFLNQMRTLILFHIRYPWVRYGSDVHVQWSTTFWSPNRQIQIGSHVGIGAFCEINTDLTIGDHVLIGSRVGLVARDAHLIDMVGATIFDAGRGDRFGIVIEDDVWIGFGAIILSGVRVGRGSVVAAGAVIVKDVPPYSIVASPAARVIRSRFTPKQVAEHEAGLRQAGILSEATVADVDGVRALGNLS